MLRILSPHDPDYETRLSGLVARGTTLPKDIETRVAEIVTKVRREGDSALREFTERFEHQPTGQASVGQCGQAYPDLSPARAAVRV